MKRIGLTGSIAMGKSETLKMFARLGVPVFDADAAVHRLYEKGGDAVSRVGNVYPDVIVDDAIDRGKLAQHVLKDPDALKRLEKIVHPLVRQQQTTFLKQQERNGATLAVLDIPLLYETQREAEFDAVVVVSTTAETQRQRALQRPGMTEEKLRKILSRQMPDAEKRERADFVVDTGAGIEAAFEQVRRIVQTLSEDD